MARVRGILVPYSLPGMSGDETQARRPLWMILAERRRAGFNEYVGFSRRKRAWLQITGKAWRWFE